VVCSAASAANGENGCKVAMCTAARDIRARRNARRPGPGPLRRRRHGLGRAWYPLRAAANR